MSKPESNWKSNCTPCCRAHYATKSGYKRLYIYLYIYILISVYIRVRIPISMCHVGLYLCGWPSPLPMWNAFLYIYENENGETINRYTITYTKSPVHRPTARLSDCPPARPSTETETETDTERSNARPPINRPPACLTVRPPARVSKYVWIMWGAV